MLIWGGTPILPTTTTLKKNKTPNPKLSKTESNMQGSISTLQNISNPQCFLRWHYSDAKGGHPWKQEHFYWLNNLYFSKFQQTHKRGTIQCLLLPRKWMLTEAKDGMASLLPQYKSTILKRITHDLLTTEPKRFHNVTFYAIQEQYKSK